MSVYGTCHRGDCTGALPNRRALYCSNSCKQKAYNDRRLGRAPATRAQPAVSPPTAPAPVLEMVSWPSRSAPGRPEPQPDPPPRRPFIPVMELPAPQPVPELTDDLDGPLSAKIRTTLREADRETTYLGVLALFLARQLETSDRATGMATLAKQLELTMGAAMKGAGPVDELERIRERAADANRRFG